MGDPVDLLDRSGLWAAGLSVELTVVAPFLSHGGGTSGINFEYTSTDGFAIYTYTPSNQCPTGLGLGGAVQFNAATGNGPWTGDFLSLEGGYGWASGGYFESTNLSPTDPRWPGYAGLSLGGSAGLPASLNQTVTTYRRIWSLR
jgi:hypothetical protein